jgi:hypothetical protein
MKIHPMKRCRNGSPIMFRGEAVHDPRGSLADLCKADSNVDRYARYRLRNQIQLDLHDLPGAEPCAGFVQAISTVIFSHDDNNEVHFSECTTIGTVFSIFRLAK